MKKNQLGANGFVSAILFYALILMANQAAFSQYVCHAAGHTDRADRRINCR